ncbi:LacI family DNA-binding transcriptional regulator [Actinomyces sp. W5033]|uniref:LacI family DNA-binding transcriptional regulator n=1 Tax=Actinomyces sp. W5033 TaxID=3446479 RepID=UPI003EE0EBB2
MTTLRDVAERAGVSAMTVSNVVNGRTGKVSAATLARVRTVIDELGYVPNAQARALAGSSSRLVALVYGAVLAGRPPLSMSHESLFVGACEQACQDRGLALMLCAAADGEEPAEALAARLRGWSVDGVICLGTLPDASRRRLATLGLAVVEVDHAAAAERPGALVVGIDDVGGGRQAGQRLREAGHRRVIMVGPDPAVGPIDADRLAGLCQGLGARVEGQGGDGAGGDAVVEHIVSGQAYDDGLAVGGGLAARLAEGERATAVFASGDVLAMGVVAGLRRHGVDVPGQVSVVGMDGFEVSLYCEPPLSTVRQPVERKAAEAVRLLVAALERDGCASREGGVQNEGKTPSQPAQVVTLPVDWREGGTLAVAPR